MIAMPIRRTAVFVRALAVLASFVWLLSLSHPAGAQESDITVIPPPPAVGEDAINQAFAAAQTMFNDGLTTMNEETIRRAAAQYEEIIQDFPNDSRHFNAYFASAYINMEYLQGVSDCEHARNLLTLLINNHPSSYPEITDAKVTLAHLEYRCFRDYRAAQVHLSELLNGMFLSKELGSRELEVKVMLAKCRQKLGEYDQARQLWEEISFANPELDTEGRLQWIQNSSKWFLIDDGTVRLYFEDGVDRDTYTRCLAAIRDGLASAESTWELMPTKTADVFLYATSDHLFDYTMRPRGFTFPADAEIHLAASELDEIPHLTGWLVAQRVNTRPEGTVFEILRSGISHYFMASRDEIDAHAAREIYYYGGNIADNELLFPLSYNYTFSEEYSAMSASFVHYLVSDRGVDIAALKRFYRLLWANPTARWQPPLLTEIMRLNPRFDQPGAVTSWQDELIPPVKLYELYRNSLGADLPAEIVTWQQTLSPEIAAVSAELGGLSAEVQRVKVDLSTPEKALESWWAAYRAGDFDALIQVSTSEMAQFLTEARDYYKQQGVLDFVILDNFIRPFRSASMTVARSGQFADDLYVFDVQVQRGDKTDQMTIVTRLENGLWKIDSN